jgi:hypothetical protein
MPTVKPEIQAMSYRYLRIAMVGLLLALAAAVFYQSSKQDSFLASVSAYYYTPAQAAFVGALIGLGASMIALQGVTPPEDMFLNLGGIFAIVVAIVPTRRGADFDTAVRACRESGGTLLTHLASKNLDCPGVLGLRGREQGERGQHGRAARRGWLGPRPGRNPPVQRLDGQARNPMAWVGPCRIFHGGAGVAGQADRPRGLRPLACPQRALHRRRRRFPRATRPRSPVSWAVPEVSALIGGFDAAGGGSADGRGSDDEPSAPAVCWPARLVEH